LITVRNGAIGVRAPAESEMGSRVSRAEGGGVLLSAAVPVSGVSQSARMAARLVGWLGCDGCLEALKIA
jgi:hypothetical protein